MSTNYYYLLFTTIRSDLMRKKEEFLKKIWKKNDDWKKNKLFAWSDYQNYFDDQNWLLIYIRNSDDKLDSIIANLVHQSTNWQKKYYTKIFALNQNRSKKMAFKNKNRKKTKLYDTASYCVRVYLVIFVNKSCFQKTRSPHVLFTSVSGLCHLGISFVF